MNLKSFHARVDAVMASESAEFNRFMEAVNNSQFTRAPGSIIVYIEDDPDHVSMFKTMVAKYSKLTVIPAFTAADGMRLLQKKNGRVKCVVMDIGLSSMGDDGSVTGLNLLRWLRENYPQTPVLVLTGHIELAPTIREAYPEVEVHIKAQESVERLVHSIEAVAFGA